MKLEHLQQLVGEKQATFTKGGGELKRSTVKARSSWVLLSTLRWLQRVDTKELVPVGGDVSFFVESIASLRDDMSHFKAGRLTLFLAGQLFNSGNRVEIYAGRGKAAAACGWRLATDAPADALARLPHLMEGSPFALPSFASSAGSSAGGSSTDPINSGAKVPPPPPPPPYPTPPPSRSLIAPCRAVLTDVRCSRQVAVRSGKGSVPSHCPPAPPGDAELARRMVGRHGQSAPSVAPQLCSLAPSGISARYQVDLRMTESRLKRVTVHEGLCGHRQRAPKYAFSHFQHTARCREPTRRPSRSCTR